MAACGDSASPRWRSRPLSSAKYLHTPKPGNLTKLHNLMQDPCERADITSNTFWDWQMNHVPQVCQGVEEVPKFLATSKEFPPRSTPQSFDPANILEDALCDNKAKQKLEPAFPMLRPELAR